MVLFLCGALSDKRMGLSLVYAARPCQRSLSWVQVPWDSQPYFTASDWRLPFLSPPTTRRVTVEAFDPVSTRVNSTKSRLVPLITPRHRPRKKHCSSLLYFNCCHRNMFAAVHLLVPRSLLSSGVVYIVIT
jgi:hypothetical protein